MKKAVFAVVPNGFFCILGDNFSTKTIYFH